MFQTGGDTLRLQQDSDEPSIQRRCKTVPQDNRGTYERRRDDRGNVQIYDALGDDRHTSLMLQSIFQVSLPNIFSFALNFQMSNHVFLCFFAQAVTQVFSFESIESKKLVSVYLELAKNEPLTMEYQGDTPPKYCSSRLKQFTMRYDSLDLANDNCNIEVPIS